MSLEKLESVDRFRESGLFEEKEQVALEYAEQMTKTGERVSEELFAQVRRHFSEAETVALTAAIALENFLTRFNTALRVEPQGWFAPPGSEHPRAKSIGAESRG